MRTRFLIAPGDKFTRLTVQSQVREGGRVRWRCICECGAIKIFRPRNLRVGQAKSCGCLSREMSRARNTSHGMSYEPEYARWVSMCQRCHCDWHPNFKDYGGRGIRVCDRWRNSFEEFIKDMGYRPSAKHSIDRINNNGNYEPGNCRWATPKEQQRNMRSNKVYTINGASRCMAEWAEIYGVKYKLVKDRLRSGKTIVEALTLPSPISARRPRSKA